MRVFGCMHLHVSVKRSVSSRQRVVVTDATAGIMRPEPSKTSRNIKEAGKQVFTERTKIRS